MTARQGIPRKGVVNRVRPEIWSSSKRRNFVRDPLIGSRPRNLLLPYRVSGSWNALARLPNFHFPTAARITGNACCSGNEINKGDASRCR